MSGLAALSGRERALLLLVLPLAVLAAGWRLGWVPLQELRAAREAEIAGYRLLAEVASGMAAAPVAAAAPAEPFAARVTASAEAAGLSLSRLEPEGDALRVTVAEAGFAAVILWLSDLEEGEEVIVVALELDRRTAPGAVSARVLLEEAR